MIEWILAGLLLFGCGLMTYGAWLVSHPAGYIVGGALLAFCAIGAAVIYYLLETRS